MIGQVFELARDMGPVFYMMCVAHVVLCDVMLVCAALKRHTPLFICFLMPCAVFLFGMMGVTLARQNVQEAVTFASVDTIDKLLLLGLSLAYAPEFAAGVLATILIVMATCSVGIGNVLGAAPQRRWVSVRGGVAAALWVVVVVLTVVLPGVLFGMDRSMFLIVCAVLCGVGVVLGSSVASEDNEGARRVARGRFALAVLSACALLGVGVAEQGRLMQAYGRQALDAGIWLDLLDHVSGESLQVILDQAWNWPVTTAWIAGGVLLCGLAR